MNEADAVTAMVRGIRLMSLWQGRQLAMKMFIAVPIKYSTTMCAG